MGRGEDLQRIHNQAQTDASNETHDLPHGIGKYLALAFVPADIVADALMPGSKSTRELMAEENEVYERAHEKASDELRKSRGSQGSTSIEKEAEESSDDDDEDDYSSSDDSDSYSESSSSREEEQEEEEESDYEKNRRAEQYAVEAKQRREIEERNARFKKWDAVYASRYVKLGPEDGDLYSELVSVYNRFKTATGGERKTLISSYASDVLEDSETPYRYFMIRVAKNEKKKDDARRREEVLSFDDEKKLDYVIKNSYGALAREVADRIEDERCLRQLTFTAYLESRINMDSINKKINKIEQTRKFDAFFERMASVPEPFRSIIGLVYTLFNHPH